MFCALATVVKAQITGEIYDNEGYPIPLASAIYKGHHVAEASDMDGKFTQYNGLIAVSVNVGVRIKHNGELTREPVCTENKDPHDVGGERQGGEQRLQLFAKAEPAIAGAEDQQRAVTEKQKAQIEQARDA